MYQTMLTAMRSLAQEWKDEATQLRTYPASATGALADAIHQRAELLWARVEQLDAAHEYLSVEQYAEHLDVSVETVRRWIRNGQLPGALPAGRTHRIHRNIKPIKLRKGHVPAN